MNRFRTTALRVLIPISFIAAWLVVGGIGGPTFGKLSSIATNDQSSFLPASAESTKVQNILPKFSTSSKIPALIVVESPATLTPADAKQLQSLVPALQNSAGVAAEPDAVLGPIVAKDHKAAEYVVLPTGKLNVAVDHIRTTVKQHTPSNLHSYVAGPAGLAADLFSAFGGLDGILLYVALGAVFIILLLVYRSIVLPFVVLATAMIGLTGAGLVIYHLVTGGLLKLNGQSQGILSILAIGAATDYSLLVIARYREALQHIDRPVDAMRRALARSFEPITASAATVIAGVLCLLFSQLNSNKDLGPVAAIGIAFSYLAAMTFLPAVLVLCGRSAFWPFRGQVAQVASRSQRLAGKGIWQAVPRFISAHPRAIWLITAVVLAGFALATPQFKADGISQTDAIVGHSDAVDGQKVLARHFPAGTGSPAVIIAPSADLAKALTAAKATVGVSTVTPFVDTAFAPGANRTPKTVDGMIRLDATLTMDADSGAARTVVTNLRSRLHAVDSAIQVGGLTAITIDSNNAATADLHTIIPIVLLVILVILMLLLRAVVAPLLLIASVILSFTATIGISALVFNHLFHFAGSDAAIPLFGFIFLVALGVDYNIFLMTRVREESKESGTKTGILHGLSVTGSVITSAGIVLAATFAALAVVPILFLAQIAFIVAFGVLLDTTIVRSLLVPALCYDIGKLIWWPAKLWHKTEAK